MRNRLGVLFPRAGFQDFFHLVERKVALLLAIVKMGRNAHTGHGTVIDKNVAREEFAADFIRVRAVYGDRSRAFRWIFWRVDFPSAGLCVLDEPSGHAN